MKTRKGAILYWRTSAAWAIATLTGGCAGPLVATPPYVGPVSGATARLLVRAQVATGDRYAAFFHANAVSCGNPARLGMGDSASHPGASALAAGQLATLEFQLYKPNRTYCAVTMSFTPLAGRSYVLTGTAQEGGCSAGVLDATDPERLRPIGDLRRRNPAGGRCVPLDQSLLMRLPLNTARSADGDAVLIRDPGNSDLSGLIPR